MAGHVAHAGGFAAAVAGTDEAVLRRAADLGSGGGVPGLPLALHFDRCHWALIESGVRRAAFLREAVAALGLVDRVEVVEARAEEVGRRPAWRGRVDLVVARGFGRPAVVAECAAPLLRVGGRAVVSEPPGRHPERWNGDGLRVLGVAAGPLVEAGVAAYQVLSQVEPCPERFPRRVGVPSKRPLF